MLQSEHDLGSLEPQKDCTRMLDRIGRQDLGRTQSCLRSLPNGKQFRASSQHLLLSASSVSHLLFEWPPRETKHLCIRFVKFWSGGACPARGQIFTSNTWPFSTDFLFACSLGWLLACLLAFVFVVSLLVPSFVRPFVREIDRFHCPLTGWGG